MQTTAYAAYTSAVVQTSTNKEDILLKLFDGALRFLRFAHTGLEQHNIAAKGTYISKSLAIISELDCALDHQVGGEIASNLSSLYQYMIMRLTHANVHNDTTAIDEVMTLMQDLQEAFEVAIASQQSKPTVPQCQQPSLQESVNIAV